MPGFLVTTLIIFDVVSCISDKLLFTSLSSILGIIDNMNALSLFAFSNHLIAFYNNNNIFDLYHEDMKKKKNQENIINKVILMIFQRNDLSLDEDENVHNFTKKEKNKITIEELVKYNLNKPSDIFVYKIFETN